MVSMAFESLIMLKRMLKLSLFCLLAILLPWQSGTPLALMQSPIGFTPLAAPSGSWVNIPQPWAMPSVDPAVDPIEVTSVINILCTM